MKVVLALRHIFFLSLLCMLVLGPALAHAAFYDRLDRDPMYEVDVVDEYVVFDSFFNDTPEKLKKDHLDFFALTLNERSKEIGYAISYGGPNDLCESLANLKTIWKYLVSKKQVDPDRIVLIDGGFLKKKGMTDFFIISTDTRPPTPSPSFRINDVLRMNPE